MKRSIIITIEPHEDGRRCGDECTGVFWDEDGICLWSKNLSGESVRGMECISAERRLRELVEAGSEFRDCWGSIDAELGAVEYVERWDAAVKALEEGE